MPILKPEDVQKAFDDNIPSFVIDAFSACIKENFSPETSKANFNQDTVINKMKELNKTLTRQEVFSKKYLSVESRFASVGWQVTYTSPDRDEDFIAYFDFVAPRITK